MSLPALSEPDAAATKAFLTGDGAPLVDLLATARTFAQEERATSADCTAALEVVGAGPSPVALAELAGRVADPVLSAAFLSAVTATDEYLTRCTKGERLDDSRSRLQQVVALTDARIAEL